jgi:hypothetical protein
MSTKERQISEFDPVADKILNSIPRNLVQAQYGTREQMQVMLWFAVKLKLYDAVDYIENSYFKDNP